MIRSQSFGSGGIVFYWFEALGIGGRAPPVAVNFKKGRFLNVTVCGSQTSQL